ncbi:MAG: YadA-like family protein, partial [Pseudomonadota bacterium]
GLSGGIAAAMALGGAPIIPGQSISLWANAATYGGEQGYALSVTGRVAERVYISAGASGNTGDGNFGGRVGVGIGF